MKKHLMSAVPPVPQRYLAKMDDTLKEICDMEHMKKHRHRYGALAVALALVIALAGLAYAAANQSGILDRLFPGATPPPEVEQAIVKTLAEDSAEGVTLSIDEYLYDSNTLHVNWTVRSERDEPVYYLTKWSSTIDDAIEFPSVFDQGGSTGDCSAITNPREGIFSVLSGVDDQSWLSRSRSEYYRESAWGYTLNKPFEVQITVYAFTSPLELVQIAPSEALPLNEPEDPVLQRLLAARQIGTKPMSGQVNMKLYPEVQQTFALLYPYTEAVEAYFPGYVSGLKPEEYEQTGLMNPIATLTATVTIDPGQLHPMRHTEPVQRDHVFSKGRIEIIELDASATATRMTFRLYPGDWTISEFKTMFNSVLLDADGEIIDMSHFGGDSDRDYYNVSLAGNPLKEMPEHVYLIPRLSDNEFAAAIEKDALMKLEKIRIDLKRVE